jgi:hypothetical protein
MERKKSSPILLLFFLLLEMLLLAFQSLPVVNGSALQFTTNIGLQRARVLAYEKNVFILTYSQNTEKKAQAADDIQIIIPLFETEQALLTTVNNTDIQLLANAIRADFLFLDTEMKSRKKTYDTADIDLILFHENQYTAVLNQINLITQNRISDGFFYLFLLESSIDACLFFLFLYFYKRKDTRTYGRGNT